MPIYQFTTLDEMEQIKAIWDAVEVGEYQDDVYLYKWSRLMIFMWKLKSTKSMEYT